MTELLIPAGSPEVLKTAVRYGADAVYVGGEEFSLRAKAKNFTKEQLAWAVGYCHERGKKLYVTANIIAHNRDLAEAREYFESLNEIGPDAVIIADAGMFAIAKKMLRPEIAIHISTQANNVNSETFRFWYDLGASRVVCGRELSLGEIAQIRSELPEGAEIEAFVHGAMCIAYSGRCLMSAYFTGREANLGACTHPCRWNYYVTEETRPGEYVPVSENERGTFLFSSKDLCAIGLIPDLIRAGVDSFKVEGRMKTALYVATVARAYRMAIDAAVQGLQEYEAVLPRAVEELGRCGGRGYTTGFFLGKPDTAAQTYESSAVTSEAVFLGIIDCVEPDGCAWFLQKNKFAVGDTIEFMKPDGTDVAAKVLSMWDEDGNEIADCPHPSVRVKAKFSAVPEIGDVMRLTEGNAR